MSFEQCYQFTMGAEGGYANLKGDAGGRTIYGIAENFFPQQFNEVYNLYIQNKIDQAKALAEKFYEQQFFNPIAMIPYPPVGIVFDSFVNMGYTAIRILQQTINNLYSTNLTVDGALGPLTEMAIKRLAEPDYNKFCRIYTDLRKQYYWQNSPYPNALAARADRCLKHFCPNA